MLCHAMPCNVIYNLYAQHYHITHIVPYTRTISYHIIPYDNVPYRTMPIIQRIVEEIMREREEEVRNINKGMHQVNEIYKVRKKDHFICHFVI